VSYCLWSGGLSQCPQCAILEVTSQCLEVSMEWWLLSVPLFLCPRGHVSVSVSHSVYSL
ncbi:hypothetical protein NDU88_000257, partial [Pleurodeles waltl]